MARGQYTGVRGTQYGVVLFSIRIRLFTSSIHPGRKYDGSTLLPRRKALALFRQQNSVPTGQRRWMGSPQTGTRDWVARG